MSFAALNDAAALSGSVVLPFAGAWHAQLTLDTQTPPAGAVTLALDEGAVTLRGTVVRARETFGRVEVLLVGGAGGLWAQVAGRHYRSTPASLIWGAILSECGEVASGASWATPLASQLAQWTRIRSSGADALTRLTDALGGVWRVDLDGTVRLVDPSATSGGAVTGTQVEDCPGEASALWALDTHTLTPGQLLAGRRVRDLEHQIAPQSIRTRVWYG